MALAIALELEPSETDHTFLAKEMSPIGPELPPHLLDRQITGSQPKSPGPAAIVGPEIPPHLIAGTSKQSGNEAEEQNEDDDDDDYGPMVPPNHRIPSGSEIGATALSRKIFSPSLPPPPSQNHDRLKYAGPDDDSDDDIGPMPLPPGVSFEEEDGVREFMEREERRRKQIEVRLAYC